MDNKKNKKKITQVEVMKSIRKDWGNISPVTKVIPNKKSGRYNRAREKRTKENEND